MKSYALLVKLAHPVSIRIGRLGTFDFPKGYYVYSGSAIRNIDARIARHLRRDKKKRWHIDYLLEEALVKSIFLSTLEECMLNKLVFEAGATSIVPGFGSSDCRKCGTHLASFKEKPDLSELLVQSLLHSHEKTKRLKALSEIAGHYKRAKPFKREYEIDTDVPGYHSSR